MITQSVKLPHKQKELSSMIAATLYTPSQVLHTCHSSDGEAEAGVSLGLSKMASSRLVEDYLKNQGGEGQQLGKGMQGGSLASTHVHKIHKTHTPHRKRERKKYRDRDGVRETETERDGERGEKE